MTDRTAVAQARSDLHDVLKSVTPQTWRVHRTDPVQITAPMVFIDSPTIATQQPGLVAVTFPVVMVVDGSVTAQVEQLDDLLSAVWTAASKVGSPTNASPAALDVGGPSLRAQVLGVQIVMAATTMCPPSLLLAPPEPQPEPGPPTPFAITTANGSDPMAFTFGVVEAPGHSVEWAFGDGAFDAAPSDQTIDHTYAEPGTYAVVANSHDQVCTTSLTVDTPQPASGYGFGAYGSGPYGDPQ